jgi:hypothetical protein
VTGPVSNRAGRDALGARRIGPGGGGAAAPDLVVLAGWWTLIVAIGFLRTDFCGDGLRHLPALLQSARPHLGEPRWLLFPALLYLLLRPAVALGLVHDVAGLAHLMMAATVAAAGIYLLAVRACLTALGLPPGRRAIGLLAAGGSAGLLLAATDLMEPIFGATLVAVGLAAAARRAAAPGASAGDRRLALLVAVTAVAAATLLYQGLLLGLGLIPLVVPLRTLWDRRAWVPAALILAAVPLLMIGVPAANGNSLRHAVERALVAEENPLYRSYLAKPGLTPYLVALVAGLPHGIVSLGEHHGFHGVLADLHDPATRRPALAILLRLGFSMVILAALALAAWRRRDWALLCSFAALAVLPVVRTQEYGYLKFFILMPIVLAFGAARAPKLAAAAVATLVLGLNAAPLVAGLPAQRQLYDDRVAVYRRADAHSCWLTTAWIPRISFRWPGTVCPVLGSLASGAGEDPASVEAAGRAALTACLEDCFCRSSAVFTDDMIDANARPLVADSARHFAYAAVDLQAVVLPLVRAEIVSRPGATPPVYRYPPGEQRRRCGLVRR